MSEPLVLPMLIDGERVEARSGERFEVLNPSTGAVYAVVPQAGPEDVDLAVAAARRAFPGWSRLSATERGRKLAALARALEARKDDFVVAESSQNGKTRFDADFDVTSTIACLDYYAGMANAVMGETISGPEGYLVYTRREPVGVCGLIVPWNFPIAIAVWKLAPALAAGCTVVLKVAEQTPLTALRVGELILEAGFPPGVVNILTGYGPTAGQALARHMDVDKVAFTGSTEVGHLIMKYAAESNLKRVTLELGGKSPNIVFADTDLDQAAEGAHFALYFNQGQCCCAGSRLFVEQKIYEPFLEKLVTRARGRKVGDPFARETEQGPQVDREQFNKVLGYIDAGRQEGAKLLCGGGRVGNRGFFVEPTIFADVRDEMKIAQEEIFGPVMAVMPFRDLDEVVQRANKTMYGLAAAVWTSDITKAHAIANSVRAGTVWVNCYDVFDAAAPFGGYKQSGLGRELGEYGLMNYLEVKTVTIKL